MDDSTIFDTPNVYPEIMRKSEEIDFSMGSDLYEGSLLKTLITSKPKGRFLELGTGTGLSLSWMVQGIDDNSSLITIDNDSQFIEIAKEHLGNDRRIQILCEDGVRWIKITRVKSLT